jgi:hypothetical protein
MIFPLNFLKIKFYIKQTKILKAIDIINLLIKKYEDYNLNIKEKKLDLKMNLLFKIIILITKKSNLLNLLNL